MKLTECLCCGGSLTMVLDWGDQPLANNYNVKEKFPIKLNRCERCFHLQLDEAVDPNILFKDYPYFSGTSKTSLDYFKEFAEIALRKQPEANNVYDIAANDGSQLDAFKELGLFTYGIDPAENLAPVSSKKGHQITCGAFPDNLPSIVFDIVTAQNVVAHVADPLSFLQGCYEIMHDQSLLMVATSQADMIVHNEQDTIYSEHISYFNTLSMQKLCERANLVLEDVFTHPIHGTSYIFIIRKVQTPDPVIVRIKSEAANGLYKPETYEKWVELCREKSQKTKEKIEQYRKDGYLIVGCAAAAKGITFLNVTKTQMDFIVDTTPAKWYAEVCNTTIYPFEYLRTIQADKVLWLLLAWNFKIELTENILKYRNNPNDIFITTND